MRDRRQIRALREAEGISIRGIVRETGASRNAVRRALAPGARERYSRPSLTDEFEPAVRDVLMDCPRLPVDEVAVLVEWPASRRQLSKLVARIRPEALARETEDLNSPRLGTVRVGTIRVGRMAVGTMKVGELHGREAERA